MAYKPVFINATSTGSATIDEDHDVLHAVVVAIGGTGSLFISDATSYDSAKIVLAVDASHQTVIPVDIELTTGLSWNAQGGTPELTLLLGR